MTWLGYSGLAVAASTCVDGVDLVGVRAQVDLRGVAVEAEVLLRGGESDQHRGVDLGGEHGGVEDAGEVEPLPCPTQIRSPG